VEEINKVKTLLTLQMSKTTFAVRESDKTLKSTFSCKYQKANTQITAKP